jgi:hypothetical protein
MLETGSVLATWALPLPPNSNHEFPAQSLPDHRLEYLDYEGPVSGDRGGVVRWDGGTYEVLEQTDERLAVRLCGDKLIGRAELARLSGRPDRWQFRLMGSGLH